MSDHASLIECFLHVSIYLGFLHNIMILLSVIHSAQRWIRSEGVRQWALRGLGIACSRGGGIYATRYGRVGNQND